MRRRFPATATAAVLGVLVLAAGYGAWGGDTPPDYIARPVERGSIVTAIAATGTVEAVGTVKVGTQISGQIAELLVDFDQEVRRGQPIARLDPALHQAQVSEARASVQVAETDVATRTAAVERARADLRNATAGIALVAADIARAESSLEEAGGAFERKRILAAGGGVAQSGFDQARTRFDIARAEVQAAQARKAIHATVIERAEADLRMAESQRENAEAMLRQRRSILRQAELHLERTEIRSPVDGVVIARNVDEGQTVAASLEAPTLFTIARDLRHVEVRVRVDEADIGRIRPGQPTRFTVDAYPGQTFDGRVAHIRKAAEASQTIVTYPVLIAADNPDLLLFPGMTATVRIVVDEVRGVLRVPNAALRFQPPAAVAGTDAADGPRVWIPGTGGRPVAVPVRLGASDATATEVRSGPLEEGAPVIVGVRPADTAGVPAGLRFGS